MECTHTPGIVWLTCEGLRSQVIHHCQENVDRGPKILTASTAVGKGRHFTDFLDRAADFANRRVAFLGVLAHCAWEHVHASGGNGNQTTATDAFKTPCLNNSVRDFPVHKPPTDVNQQVCVETQHMTA